MAAFNQNIEMVGPYQSCAAGATGSQTELVNIPAAGVYECSWKCDVPSIVQGSATTSGLVVRVRNNTTSTNIFLGVAGACSGGRVTFSAAASDVISLNLSSTAAADLVSLNCVKGAFSLSGGVS